MAADIIARGMAANAGKGGGGGGGATYDMVQYTDKDGNVYYRLTENGENVGDAIKIPVPKVAELRSGTVKKCTVADNPVPGYKVGDEYMDFIIDTDDKPDTGDEKHVYILVSELKDTDAEKIDFNKSDASIITSKNVNDALNEIGVLASAKTEAAEGKNGLMSAYDKNKLDNIGTFKDDESMKLAIDGMFNGYDMSGLDPDDDDGIADHADIEDIFSDDAPPPASREPETQGSFTSLSADEIDDIFGEGTTTPTTPDDSDEEDGEDTDLDTGDIDDILGV